MSLQLREFRLIFEGLREGVAVVDPDRIREANPAFCELLEYSHSQLLRLGPLDLVAGLDRERLRALLAGSPADLESTHTLTVALRTRRGEPVPCSLRLLGSSSGWTLFAHALDAIEGSPEPTSFIRARTQKLEESRNRYRQLVESLADGLVTLNERGEFLFLNKTFADMLGEAARSRLVARRFLDLVVERDRERVSRGFARWEEGIASRFEATLLRADGAPVPVLLSGRRLSPEKNSGPGGLLMLVTDFAERRALLDRLNTARQMDALSSLAGGIAHDFNNLLTGILGNASAIRMEPGCTRTIDGLVTSVEESAEMAASLTQRLMALVRGQAPHRHLLDLSELVRQTLRLISKLLAPDTVLHTTLQAGLPPVLADESQLQQAILNLCVNARDAIAAQGGPGQIHVTVTSGTLQKPLDDGGMAEEPAVVLVVSDSGPGVPKELRRRIFDPFFTTKGLTHGTGLGLSSVYHLIDAHGGTVDVGDGPAGGAEFVLRLPAQSGRTAVPRRARQDRLRDDGARRRASVLLAEDEGAIRAMVTTALRGRGYTVHPAADGRQALELWASHGSSIDLLMLDVRMPHVDGTEVLREIRRSRPGIAAVLSSGFIPEEQEREEPLEGVIYLPKPYRLPALFAAVERALDSESGDTQETPRVARPPSHLLDENTDEPERSRPGQGFDPARTLTDAELPTVMAELASYLKD